ncbi:hybrid sensor histidine kinase/response regulator [Mucilaginibacter sp. Bleaf8]|uniref:hybrid sensor histidine kinase/response regulator n=1 Tax=Mucilaginibacter sp. Bleaf8 TaxID=2834430 RepID=UPI001BCDA7B4|nr:hybrid sensor histidine kinase/response regulator [Mucilaginibacter sp. Bleaf8]MBS7567008.1 hybrid sensor histidine kinase/response regulator [Mucilaginibacter sp. Bleaf8]
MTTATEKIKILYVDDEQENLVGFKASLRFQYQVFTAVNVLQAIDHLNNHPDIRIVFCDQRMPGQTGVEFFEQIRISHPSPIRILITAYTDVESVIDAINRGNIFRYIKKPWEEADVISAIEEANKFYLANTLLAVKHTELQKAYDELNRFAYSVSHDIRGPIAGILGAINIARDISDLNEMKEMLYLMEKSLQKLDTYVLNMNDYYSLQRGELHLQEIDFTEFFEELESIFGVVANVSKISFRINVNQQEVFRSDKALLKLIFTNLLSNAFKYQDDSKVEKSVVVNAEISRGSATVSVGDSGIGILGSHIGEIFNLFYRATSQSVGSGFGLYNVKTALLKLNGHIEVNSVMNQGTTFKVILPSI